MMKSYFGKKISLLVLFATLGFGVPSKTYSQQIEKSKKTEIILERQDAETDAVYSIQNFDKYMKDFFSVSKKSKTTFLQPHTMYDFQSPKQLTEGLDEVVDIIWKHKNKNFNPEKINPFNHMLAFQDKEYVIEVDVAGDYNNNFKSFIISDKEEMRTIRNYLSGYNTNLNLDLTITRLEKTQESEMQRLFDRMETGDNIFTHEDGNIVMKVKTADHGGPAHMWYAAYKVGQTMKLLPEGKYQYCNLTEEQKQWLSQTVRKIITLNKNLKDKYEDSLVDYFTNPKHKNQLRKLFDGLKGDCSDPGIIPPNITKVENFSKEQLVNFVRKATDYWVYEGDELTLNVVPVKEQFQNITETDLEGLINNIGLAIQVAKKEMKEYTDKKIRDLKQYTDNRIETVESKSETKYANKDEVKGLSALLPSIKAGGDFSFRNDKSMSKAVLSDGSLMRYDISSLWRGFSYDFDIGFGKPAHNVGSIFHLFLKGNDYALLNGGEVLDIDGKNIGQISNSSSMKKTELGVMLDLFLMHKLELLLGASTGKEAEDLDIKYYSTIGQSHKGGNLTSLFAGFNYGQLYGTNFGLNGRFFEVKDEREPTMFQDIGGYYSYNHAYSWNGAMTLQLPLDFFSRFNFEAGYEHRTEDRLVNTGIKDRITQQIWSLVVMYSAGQKTASAQTAGKGAFNAPGKDFMAYAAYDLVTGKYEGGILRAGITGQPEFLSQIGLMPYLEVLYQNLKEDAKLSNTTLNLDNSRFMINAGISLNLNR